LPPCARRSRRRAAGYLPFDRLRETRWTQPAGELTADVRGEIGTGYVERTAQIVERIVQAGPNTPFAAGTVAAASALRTAPVGWVARMKPPRSPPMIEELLGHSSLLLVAR